MASCRDPARTCNLGTWRTWSWRDAKSRNPPLLHSPRLGVSFATYQRRLLVHPEAERRATPRQNSVDWIAVKVLLDHYWVWRNRQSLHLCNLPELDSAIVPCLLDRMMSLHWRLDTAWRNPLIGTTCKASRSSYRLPTQCPKTSDHIKRALSPCLEYARCTF